MFTSKHNSVRLTKNKRRDIWMSLDPALQRVERVAAFAGPAVVAVVLFALPFFGFLTD